MIFGIILGLLAIAAVVMFIKMIWFWACYLFDCDLCLD